MLMLDAVQPAAPELSGAGGLTWRASRALPARGCCATPGPSTTSSPARPWDRTTPATPTSYWPCWNGIGLDTKTAAWVGMTIATYVAGAVVREIQEIRWHQDTR